jgi:hypothetical protein
MRISADNQVSRQHQSLLRQEAVFNPHLNYFKIVFDPVLSRKIPHYFTLFGGLNILIGGEMVRNQYYFILIKNLIQFQPLKFGNGFQTRFDIHIPQAVEG